MKSVIPSSTDLMTSGQIKKLLKERGWTQKMVAEYWGVTSSWINMLVNDKDKRSVRDDCAFRGLPDLKD